MTALALIAGGGAAYADTTGVAPATVVKTLPPGASTTIKKTVTTPQILPKPDIYFLADTTGSMGPAIADVQTNATSILNTVAASASDPQFGAGEYKDFPVPAGSFAFKNDQAITASKPDVIAAISGWAASGGADTPEANLFALHRVATDAGFRSGSSKVVVWFGDAPGHDPVCASVSGESTDVTEASVTAELKAAGIKVIAVSVDSGPSLNADPTAGAFSYPATCPAGGTKDQAIHIANATGGQSFAGVKPEDVSAKILEGLKALPVTVTPKATCDTGLSASFAPASATVESGSTVTFTETLTVAANAPSGASHCTVDFLLNGAPAGPAFIEKNTITVNRPPDCAKATTTNVLWPPNHKLTSVTVTVPDPDSSTVATTITGVTQDEELNANGDGTTTPDAVLPLGHPDQVQLRAERSGTGDGRVYRIGFKADDGAGGACTGTIFVGVPHDQSGAPAVDTTTVSVNSLGS